MEFSPSRSDVDTSPADRRAYYSAEEKAALEAFLRQQEADVNPRSIPFWRGARERGALPPQVQHHTDVSIAQHFQKVKRQLEAISPLPAEKRARVVGEQDQPCPEPQSISLPGLEKPCISGEQNCVPIEQDRLRIPSMEDCSPSDQELYRVHRSFIQAQNNVDSTRIRLQSLDLTLQDVQNCISKLNGAVGQLESDNGFCKKLWAYTKARRTGAAIESALRQWYEGHIENRRAKLKMANQKLAVMQEMGDVRQALEHQNQLLDKCRTEWMQLSSRYCTRQQVDKALFDGMLMELKLDHLIY